MSKYYRIRATSMSTFYSFVDSEKFPHIFDEEGNPDGYDIHAPVFDLYDHTFEYGILPVEEDWEFTDYEEISREEYVNSVTKEEPRV
tara:strand:+ start:140 stop:400 length:261 start_codon:yes stop_codon:yes gene_type:complete